MERMARKFKPKLFFATSARLTLAIASQKLQMLLTRH
jgi:hypothetical protein